MAAPFDSGPPGSTPHIYGAPPGSLSDPPSTVGKQIRTDYYFRKALVEAAKEAYFGQLADVRSMPKNMGKTIKQYHYLPILDDRNINDQGIDAQGVSTVAGFIANVTQVKAVIALQAPLSWAGRNMYTPFNFDATKIVGGPPPGSGTHPHPLPGIQIPGSTKTWPAYSVDGLPEKVYFEGMSTGATAAAAGTTALLKAKQMAASWFNFTFQPTTPVTPATIVGAGFNQNNPTLNTALWTYFEIENGASVDQAVRYGNLYGSSKDVGTIAGKMPVLSETGGRVNRVGMRRIMLEGTLEKFGFFDEYTQDSLDFDTDSDLLMHITTESVKAANEITEDQLQIDLLNSAGIVRFAGSATSTATLTGDDDTTGKPRDVVTYDDLVKLSIELDNNRCSKNTKVITGSRMIDTRVVNAARYMYVGSELIPSIMKMTDYHGEAAFVPVAQYGSAGTIARGELGTVGDFRFIVVPEMMHWEGAGAAPAGTILAMTGPDAAGVEKYNVYPMLVVGDESFTTIGFQTNGKSVKFVITHKQPGKDVADRHDPYGEVGFYSIKWYYGFMPLRPEHIALVKTVAEI